MNDRIPYIPFGPGTLIVVSLLYAIGFPAQSIQAADANSSPGSAAGMPFPSGSLGISDLEKAKSFLWSAFPDQFQFMVGGYSKINDGGGGMFSIDKSDQTSAEDGGIVFVAKDGTRLKRLSSGPVNVRWFGAKGDGKSDDTRAITAAWKYCVTFEQYPRYGRESDMPEVGGATLSFPAGDYIFLGPSLSFQGTGKTFRMIGESAVGSRIRIQNSDYFIKLGDVSALSMTGLQFFGGKGTLKITNTGTNVRGVYAVRDCSFFDYSECAIGHLASDMPAWRIENNIFFGSSKWTSIGVALSGLTDNSVIRENQFQRNRYGIKINGGYNAYIRNNDFIRFTPPDKDVADIWIVPVSGPASQGLVIAENKFGNENLRQTDFRILVAAETDASGDFTSRSHSDQDLGDRLRAGLIQLRDNNFVGITGYSHGIITSYTSDLRYVYSDNMFSGGYPPQVIEFPRGFTQTRVNAENLHDATQFYNSTETLIPPLSENPIGLTRDPWGNMSGLESSVQYFTTGDDPSYEVLIDPEKFNSRLAGTAERSPQTDAYGANDAVQLKWTSSVCYIEAPFSVKTAGKPVWVEFDARQAAAHPFKKLIVDIRPKSGPTTVFRRTIRVSQDWQRVRLLWFPPARGEYRLLFPDGLEPYQKDQSEAVVLGRLHVYQAHEPVANGLLRGTALILEAGSVPKNATDKSVIYIDPVDGEPKIKSADGKTRTIVTKP